MYIYIHHQYYCVLRLLSTWSLWRYDLVFLLFNTIFIFVREHHTRLLLNSQFFYYWIILNLFISCAPAPRFHPIAPAAALGRGSAGQDSASHVTPWSFPETPGDVMGFCGNGDWTHKKWWFSWGVDMDCLVMNEDFTRNMDLLLWNPRTRRFRAGKIIELNLGELSSKPCLITKGLLWSISGYMFSSCGRLGWWFGGSRNGLENWDLIQWCLK